jgi:hypothetical protein
MPELFARERSGRRRGRLDSAVIVDPFDGPISGQSRILEKLGCFCMAPSIIVSIPRATVSTRRYAIGHEMQPSAAAAPGESSR